MLRPVEFHAAADPGAGKANEGGLDDALAVEKVIAVGLVLCAGNGERACRGGV